MKRFSERVGAVSVPSSLQLDAVGTPLRNTVWNFTVSMFSGESDCWKSAAQDMASLFFKVPVDEIPYYEPQCRTWVKDLYYALPWHGVYDLAEYLRTAGSRILLSENFRFSKHREFIPENTERVFNKIFEEEFSGYRFIGGILSPISSTTEVVAIEAAITNATQAGLFGAKTHLEAALRLLSKKPSPDYRNSIKESISAVESVAKQLSASSGTGLAGPLNELSKTIPIHGALRTSFINLYGYTSDESGIRHSIQEEAEIGFTEAQYMLVSCSAFVHYLIQKANSAGIKLARTY